MQYFIRFFRLLKFTFLCFWVNHVYIFKKTQHICQLAMLDFHIIPGEFSCLLGGKFTPCSPLHVKYPYSKFFWSAFSRIWTEYGEIRSISPYSVQMWENADPKNSKYRHFSRISYPRKNFEYITFSSMS